MVMGRRICQTEDTDTHANPGAERPPPASVIALHLVWFLMPKGQGGMLSVQSGSTFPTSVLDREPDPLSS